MPGTPHVFAPPGSSFLACACTHGEARGKPQSPMWLEAFFQLAYRPAAVWIYSFKSKSCMSPPWNEPPGPY